MGVATIVVVNIVWSFLRGRTLVERWAKNNGFQILQSEIRPWCAGPFTWRSSRGQIVYFVRVLDTEGKERSGWVQCGSFWCGVSSDKTEVRWRNQP